MDAKELMIDDWVRIVEPSKYAGAIGRIKTLRDHKDEENAYFKVFLRNNTIHIGIEDICSEDIRPIPLTTEILVKNGFKDYDSFATLDTEKYRVIYAFDGFITIVDDDNQRKVSYLECDDVHVLQHAMRICGIEKEIKV